MLTINCTPLFSGGTPSCLLSVDFDDSGFCTDHPGYLVPAFLEKSDKDSRRDIAQKWHIILNEKLGSKYYSSHFYQEPNNQRAELLSQAKLELSELARSNHFLKEFLSSYEIENNWCGSKLKKALKFSSQIQQHLPDNEFSYRMSASRIIMSGNWCFQRVDDDSDRPSTFSLDEIYPEVEKLMSPVYEHNFTDQEKKVLSPWNNYMIGAVSYNDPSLYGSTLDETSKYFRYFDGLELSEKKLEGYPLWIVEATKYMQLLVGFKKIVEYGVEKEAVEDWKINYQSFSRDFPSSEFINHLKNMEFGILWVSQNYDEANKLFLKDLNRSIKNLEKNKLVSWLDGISLNFFPTFIYKQKDIIIELGFSIDI